MIAYHKETIDKHNFFRDFSSIIVYERKDPVINECLAAILESQKIMQFSKFILSQN